MRRARGSGDSQLGGADPGAGPQHDITGGDVLGSAADLEAGVHRTGRPDGLAGLVRVFHA